MNRVGLICSVGFECEELLRNAALRNRIKAGGLTFSKGRLQGKATLLVASGAGKVNAAHAATIMIERFGPELIINFGVGGAYPDSGLGIGDIAVADREIYGDEGIILRKGFKDLRFMGLPVMGWELGFPIKDFVDKVRSSEFKEQKERPSEPFYNYIPVDKRLMRKTATVLRRLSINHVVGPFVTLSAVTGTSERAGVLQKRYGAVCENMEGAAVAHVCLMHGVPFIEVRGISNIVKDRDKRRWNIRKAAGNCQWAVMHLIEAL